MTPNDRGVVMRCYRDSGFVVVLVSVVVCVLVIPSSAIEAIEDRPWLGV